MCYDVYMDGANPTPSPAFRVSEALPLRRKVLSLRYMGYESAEIAQILNVSEGSVQHHLNAAVRNSSDAERVNFVREAEISKLEEIEEAFIPAALGQISNDEGPIPPSPAAAKVVLDVMDRRSKLLGIDKAQPQISTTNLTLIQILSQIPSPALSPPTSQNATQQLEGANTQTPRFSREATDA